MGADRDADGCSSATAGQRGWLAEFVDNLEEPVILYIDDLPEKPSSSARSDDGKRSPPSG